jgi:hypothetical protein
MAPRPPAPPRPIATPLARRLRELFGGEPASQAFDDAIALIPDLPHMPRGAAAGGRARRLVGSSLQ